ncbi:hypothetical protein RF11_06126 [Thelohanellus kitauei]|uniref:Uncharacterized protein n=1 Tax=Thelohanellus kitauei TaxID=669202 RepID=A0A0C2MKJ3_THEKT|nr:hypothetical protein RF11_06126 [Thelohanellus kitauei]
MFPEFMYVDHRENQIPLTNYIQRSKSLNIFNQMDAVENIIYRFYYQHHPRADYVFIKHFPKKVLDAFVLMINYPLHVSRSLEKKILFLKVLAFMFRNTNVLRIPKAKLFTELFLKFIKNVTRFPDVNPNEIFHSIEICTLYEPHKVLFINENGMFYFYHAFQQYMPVFAPRFLALCHDIYSLDHTHRLSISLTKLTDDVNQIMDKFPYHLNINLEKLLFLIFQMLNRLKLLDDYEFNTIKFYEISFTAIYGYNKPHKSPTVQIVSNIWVSILTRPGNTFKIDTVTKLIFLCTVFAIKFSKQLRKVIRGIGHFEFTETNKQMLYIIYFTLFSFPIFEPNEQQWVYKILTELHSCFTKYLEAYPIDDLTIENKLFVLQYYIKSYVTLHINFSSLDEQFFHSLFERLVSYPSMRLYSSFLASHLLFKFTVNWAAFESFNPDSLRTIKRFLEAFILALSDEWYITKLQSEQTLFLFENLKNILLSIIDEDFIQTMLSQSESHLRNSFAYEYSETEENDEYKIYKTTMAMTVLSFNDSNSLDRKIADTYLQLCDDVSKDLYQMLVNPYRSDNMSGSTHFSDRSHKILFNRLPFPALLRWLMLIFELKFIFGDINSKFADLNFL